MCLHWLLATPRRKQQRAPLVVIRASIRVLVRYVSVSVSVPFRVCPQDVKTDNLLINSADKNRSVLLADFNLASCRLAVAPAQRTQQRMH